MFERYRETARGYTARGVKMEIRLAVGVETGNGSVGIGASLNRLAVQVGLPLEPPSIHKYPDLLRVTFGPLAIMLRDRPRRVFRRPFQAPPPPVPEPPNPADIRLG